MPNLSPLIQYSKPIQRLAVKLNAKGERIVYEGHPWIFSNSIVKITKGGNAGDIAVIFSKNKNKVIGVGLYDPDSPIQIKMLHHGDALPIDAHFFKSRVEAAYSKREDLLKTETNSYRLLFGENDGFPGLIADVYAETLVLKLYSEIWLPYLQTIIDALLLITKSTAVVLRLSRKLQASKSHLLKDGQVVYGDLENETVEFIEHGVKFSANVIKGHKTGYFLDHRHNRKRVGALSKGKTVLDVFAYAGGFSVHALVNGATEVTSLDISDQALEMAKNNVKMNPHKGKHHCLVGDAFARLQMLIKEGKQYDVVIIDPPSFAKRQAEVAVAKKKYRQLAELGARLTASKGLMVLASCSSRLEAEEYFSIVETALNHSKRIFKILERTYHDSDHPITFKEGAYLKCGYYRFSD